MCIAFLSIIKKLEGKTQCPYVGECLNKLWYIRIKEYCPLIKSNELLMHMKTWENLQRIILNEK